MRAFFTVLLTISSLSFFAGCRSGIQTREDSIYSRHLQEHIKLSIISTPIPGDKSEMNLLLLNDGQDVGKLELTNVVDSLYKNHLIQPLMIVAIHALDRERIYGVAGIPDYKNRGAQAGKYAEFIDDELYAFIRKKAGVRKFNSVAMAGFSMGGLSAFDIAWNHADKINKVGVFSGSFWWRDKDDRVPGYSDSTNRIMLNSVRSSRKKPRLKYWFYAGTKEEAGDRDKDGMIDVIDDTRDLVNIIKNKGVTEPRDIIYVQAPDGQHDYPYWRRAFPGFLTWAFGR